MYEYLQTPEGIRLTAIVTIWIIAAAFLLGVHPFKAKKRLVIANLATTPWQPVKHEETKLWSAGDYFTFLSSMVRSSPTLEELAETMPLIEGFFDKPFRVPISNYQLKKYYARLLEVYSAREKDLVYVPIALHNN